MSHEPFSLFRHSVLRACVTKTFHLEMLLFYYCCHVAVIVLWLYLMVLWFGLQCVVVVSPKHTHFFYIVSILFHFQAPESPEWYKQVPCVS